MTIAIGHNDFLRQLRQTLNSSTGTENVEYLYDESIDGERRWKNLKSYLMYMEREKSQLMLIGEAPGYRGTSVSGVPFLSEDMIKHRLETKKLLPLEQYLPAIATKNGNGFEATSKFMWETLDAANLPKLPFLWATFPNHPYQRNFINSNRAPNKMEIETGIDSMNLLSKYFSINQIVAIGNVAYESLQSFSITPIAKLRHPAHGGSRKFKEGFMELMDNIYGKS